MLGGATEFDPAMEWFLDRASGGDILVLRASGSDDYNDYMYSDLDGVNSVETIVFNDASASHVFASDGREVNVVVKHQEDRSVLLFNDVAMGVFLLRLIDQGKLSTWKVAVTQP